MNEWKPGMPSPCDVTEPHGWHIRGVSGSGYTQVCTGVPAEEKKKRSEKRRLTCIVQFRCTIEERDRLLDIAAANGMNISELIRHSLRHTGVLK